MLVRALSTKAGPAQSDPWAFPRAFRVFSELMVEAVERADAPLFEDIPFRVVRADYLAVIALGVGRPKDFARVLALLESGSFNREEIAALARRHGLGDAWKRFEARFLDG